MKFTQDCLTQIYKLKSVLDNADAVIIGAGAGLSTAAGFTYSGARFEKHFADFENKYGFHDMYSGGFYPYDSLEEFWAYWSRYIFINRYCDAPFAVYNELYGLVKNKDYFIITTNVDHCFQKAGFDKKRLFYTQGDYGLFQCSAPCHNKTYDNEELVRRMYAEQNNMRIPSRLIPYCPICGKPMAMNLRADYTFVQDDGWNEACVRYKSFMKNHKKGKILFLELGVGMNTPVIIKYPFLNFTVANPQAVYACVNLDGTYEPKEIESRSIYISADIKSVLEKMAHIE